MSEDLSQEQLLQLGLDSRLLGVCESLPSRKEEVGEGAPFRHVLALSLAAIQHDPSVEFERVGLAATADVAQIEVMREQDRVLRVTLFDEHVSVIRSLGAEGESFLRYGEAPGTVLVSLKEEVPTLVLQPSGRGFLFSIGVHGERQVTPVSPHLVVPLREQITAPIADWCRMYVDPLTQLEVSRWLSIDDPWAQSVAAGIYARLLEPVSADARRAAIEATLSSSPDEYLSALARPRQWVRQLNLPQQETMRRLAIAAADSVLSMLEEMGAESGAPSADWTEDLRWACHARDDLEGVRVLLAEVGGDESLQVMLDLVDELGESQVFRLRAEHPFSDDKRLVRVALADPTAWWTLAAWGSSSDDVPHGAGSL